MAANVAAMVREGVSALKAGRKEEARALLLKATELDGYNEEAWLWLSGIVDSPQDQRTCLENVLSINPGNQRALQGLAYLERGEMPAVATPKPAPRPAPVMAEPPVLPPVERSASTATSVEWDMGAMETSSASASYRPSNEPSASEYDDWVTNLGLSGEEGSVVAASASIPANTPSFDDEPVDQSPFGDFSFSQDEIAQLDERALFQSGSPFTPKSKDDVQTLPPANARRREEPEDWELAAERAAQEADEDVEGPLFGKMPRSIQVTRLAGTIERSSPLLRVAAGLLIVLNLAAATLLVFKLVN